MKKNQIALMCLTAVIMLAVWYIKSLLSKKPSTTDTVPAGMTSTGRLTALTKMRETLRTERNNKVAVLDEVIASPKSTVAEKNEAMTTKESLSDLTEQEVLMELSIINLGYTDAFVHASSSGVEILVIADTLSETQVLDIMSLAYASFNQETVVVSYHPASYYIES